MIIFHHHDSLIINIQGGTRVIAPVHQYLEASTVITDVIKYSIGRKYTLETGVLTTHLPPINQSL